MLYCVWMSVRPKFAQLSRRLTSQVSRGEPNISRDSSAFQWILPCHTVDLVHSSGILLCHTVNVVQHRVLRAESVGVRVGAFT